MNQSDIDKYIDKLIAKAEREVEKVLAERLKYIRTTFADMFAKYQDEDAHVTWTEFNKYNRLNKEMDRIADLLKGDYAKIAVIIQQAQQTIYIEDYMRSLYLYEMASQTEMTFVPPSVSTIKEALAQPIEFIKLKPTLEKHRKRVIEQLQASIAQGILAGEGYNAIANDITRRMNMSQRQARMVARTEGGRAFSMAQENSEQVAKDNGADITAYWDATLDARTRPSHRKMDGKTVNKDGVFKVGRSVGPSPRLLVGIDSAKQNINCRCKKLYEVGGKRPDTRSARNAEGKSVKIPYISYEEWAKQKRSG